MFKKLKDISVSFEDSAEDFVQSGLAATLATIAGAKEKQRAQRKNDTNAATCQEENNRNLEVTNVTEIKFNGSKFKSDVMSMWAPVFSIRKKDMDVRSWCSANGLNKLTVTPSHIGSATIFDKDLLIYIFTCLANMINNRLPVTKKVRFHPRNYFEATSKSVGGHQYVDFEQSLDRLAGTILKTNIKSNDIEMTSSFHLIEGYTIIKEKSRTKMVEVTLSTWLYNAVLGLEFLTINKDYFKITGAINRRIYEISRKQVGAKTGWKVGLGLLLGSIASNGTVNGLKRVLQESIKTDAIPEYTIEIERESLLFQQKKKKVKKDETVS